MRRFVLTFLASFFGILFMLFLYVYIPLYLLEKFDPKTYQHLIEALPASEKGMFPQPKPTPTPSPTPRPTPDLAPATLIMPKLKIQAAVENVGLTPTNNMDVPKDASDVAWYMYGPAPGQNGNAVINGHYDTPTGRPAIFYYLKNMAVGDEIEVISINAVHQKFVVTEVASIPYDAFPNEFIFKTKPGKNLNLITCAGVWDQKTHLYSNRTVVYTTLKE